MKNNRINEATYLFSLGLNTFPTPIVSTDWGGRKPPYTSTTELFYTRVSSDSISPLFFDSNIAVICGRTSLNLFVIDCDSFKEFERIGEILESENIDTWISTSSRGGHYWFLSTEGEVKNAKHGQNIDILGNRCYVLAPPSIHPNGTIYDWGKRDTELPISISPTELGEILGISIETLQSDNNIHQRVLVEKNIEDYASNSEAEIAVVFYLGRLGYSDEMIIAEFEKYHPPHYAAKRNPNQWLLKYMIEPMRERIDTPIISSPHPPNDHGIQWTGRTAETDRRVYDALKVRERLDRNLEFRASIRELAMIAGLHRKTVEKSLRRLKEMDLIEWKGRADGSGAYIYAFK